jgi:hypothetical protein
LEALLAVYGDDAADVILLEEEALELVQLVPHLLRDLQSLRELLDSDAPSERVIRVKTIVHVVYGFGNASGARFGSSMQHLERLGRLHQFDGSTKLGKKGLWYQIGVWGKDTEHASSNYREMRNIVGSLEDAASRERGSHRCTSLLLH